MSLDQVIEQFSGAPKRGPYSFSRLDTCPLQFKLGYIDKVKGTELTRFGTSVGSWMHDLAEIDIKSRVRDGKEVTTDAVVDAYLEKHPDAAEYAGDLSDQLDLFRNSFEVNRPHFVDSEMFLGVDLKGRYVGYSDPNCWFRGRTDYLEVSDGGIARVVDFKNYPGMHGNDALNNIYEGVGSQLLGYGAMVLAANPNIEAITVEVYYFRFGVSKTPMVRQDDGSWSQRLFLREEVELWWRSVQRRMLAFERRTTFEPVPSQKHCQYCPFVAQCSWHKARSADEIIATNNDEALALANRLMLIKEEESRIKHVLSLWTAQHGAVQTADGKSYGPTPYERVSVDVGNLIDVCKEAGVDPTPFLTSNKTQIKRLERLLTDDSHRSKLQSGVSTSVSMRTSYG